VVLSVKKPTVRNTVKKIVLAPLVCSLERRITKNERLSKLDDPIDDGSHNISKLVISDLSH
jgi:hypothetical protein